MSQKMPLKSPRKDLRKSLAEMPLIVLSPLMEKRFNRFRDRPAARQAYVEAEIITGLAHQIRELRIQRGWTQKQLAEKLETSQSVVSRIEDTTYGKLSVQTLINLSNIFDVGLQVNFISTIQMLVGTFHPTLRKIASFEEEKKFVCFSSEFFDRDSKVKIDFEIIRKNITKTFKSSTLVVENKLSTRSNQNIEIEV